MFYTIFDDTKNKILKYLEVRDKEIKETTFLIVKENGEPLSPVQVYNIIRNHLNDIPTLSKRSPHVIRHSFATEMMNNGAEINAKRNVGTC